MHQLMLDECNANQITLARHFQMHLFIISVQSGTWAVHHSDFCLLFPLSTGPLLPVVVNKTCETIAEYRYIIAII